MAWSSSRCRKRYRVVKSGTLTNGQQLRLVELVLAEAASVARERRPADLQGDASERRNSRCSPSLTSASRKVQSSPPDHVANNNFNGSGISNFHCRDEDGTEPSHP